MNRAAKTWRLFSLKSWRADNLTRHPLFPSLLLIAVTLAVYYPVLYSGFHPVDDTGIVAFYGSSPSLAHLLVPGNSYYYRPLIELSFWLDNRLWEMEPSVMHLENLLLHCINTILVYRLGCKTSAGAPAGAGLLALTGALLFAVHPVNVEAVAWVAGRTDLLMTAFVLAATLFWLCWLEQGGRLLLAGTLLLSLLAMLTKETAFAFGGVLLLTALLWPGSTPMRSRLWALALFATPVVVLLGFKFLASGGTGGMGILFSGIDHTFAESLMKAGAAAGFYLKKAIVPFPLNFAVDQVSLWYIPAVIVFVSLLWWLYRKNRQAAFWWFAGLLMLIPPLLIAIKQIAWTPVAERYLYLPLGFFCVALAASVPVWHEKAGRWITAALLAVIGVFSVASFQQTLLWKDKQAFFEDAVNKSPGFGSVYSELGGILLRQGDLEQAEKMFTEADRLNRRESMRTLIKANMMAVQFARGDHAGVRESFFMHFKSKENAAVEHLELLLKADSKRFETLSGKERLLLAADMLDTLDIMNRKKPDSFWLYRSGQISFTTGNKAQAARFFRKVLEKAPVDSHYRGAAATYLKKMESSR